MIGIDLVQLILHPPNLSCEPSSEHISNIFDQLYLRNFPYFSKAHVHFNVSITSSTPTFQTFSFIYSFHYLT